MVSATHLQIWYHIVDEHILCWRRTLSALKTSAFGTHFSAGATHTHTLLLLLHFTRCDAGHFPIGNTHTHTHTCTHTHTRMHAHTHTRTHTASYQRLPNRTFSQMIASHSQATPDSQLYLTFENGCHHAADILKVSRCTLASSVAPNWFSRASK